MNKVSSFHLEKYREQAIENLEAAQKAQKQWCNKLLVKWQGPYEILR